MTFPCEFRMMLIQVLKCHWLAGQSEFETDPEFYVLHMHRNAKMEVEIDNFLLDKGTGQSLVDYENLKLDQDINMVFWL